MVFENNVKIKVTMTRYKSSCKKSYKALTKKPRFQMVAEYCAVSYYLADTFFPSFAALCNTIKEPLVLGLEIGSLFKPCSLDAPL